MACKANINTVSLASRSDLALRGILRAGEGHGQEPKAKTIAQLAGASLARLYGRPADGFNWNCISMYAQPNNPHRAGRLCMSVLERT